MTAEIMMLIDQAIFEECESLARQKQAKMERIIHIYSQEFDKNL